MLLSILCHHTLPQLNSPRRHTVTKWVSRIIYLFLGCSSKNHFQDYPQQMKLQCRRRKIRKSFLFERGGPIVHFLLSKIPSLRSKTLTDPYVLNTDQAMKKPRGAICILSVKTEATWEAGDNKSNCNQLHQANNVHDGHGTFWTMVKTAPTYYR